MKFARPTARTLAALLILLTVVAYLPALGAGYIWDDDTLLTANPQMRSTAGLVEIWEGGHSRDYTPLTLSVFWLEWRLWGDNAPAYHTVNVLLHALAAVLLWLVLRRLRVPGAWLGAMLFAIHPVNVASVAWVAELKNTLSGVLFFGAILEWLVSIDEERLGRYCAALGLFAAAALSKGAVVTLPGVLLICLLWKRRHEGRRIARQDVLGLIPFALIAAAAAALTIRFQARAPHYHLIPDSVAYRLSRAGADVWYYLGGIFWPVGLSPMEPPWLPALGSISAWLPLAGLVTVAAFLIWRLRGWGGPLLYALGYFLLMLLPVLGFVWMTLMQETPATDWWQYLAAPGIFACLGAAGAMAYSHWRLSAPVIGFLIGLMMTQTWQRAEIYKSMATYCAVVTAEDPHAWTLQNNLGIMLKRTGHYTEAEAAFHQSLQDNPGYVEAHINLGNNYAAAGNAAGAEAEYRRAMQMRPGDPQSLQPLADLLAQEGRFGEAYTFQVGVLAYDPRNPTGLCKLAVIEVRLKRFPDAINCLRNASALAPADLAIHIQLCETLLAGGQHRAAIAELATAQSLARQSGSAAAIDAVDKLRALTNGPGLQ